jgi:hypothetical protein
VRLILEVANALLQGRLPSWEAAVFVGGALLAWLASGGRLEKDHFKVTASIGSKRTPAAIAQELLEEDAEHKGP